MGANSGDKRGEGWPTEDNPLIILHGDTRKIIRRLPESSVQCVVTSPPYWGVRDYKVDGQIGAETSLDEYLEALVDVFREVRRVLTADGALPLGIDYRNAEVLGSRAAACA
jgi:DNA modification methylase